MNAQERRKKIYNILLENRDTTVEELSRLFNKSITSIYNDIKILEKQNMLEKTYRGVILNKTEEAFYNFNSRVLENHDIKQKMAKEAVKLIKDKDIIAIDPSTTINHIIQELRKENDKEITLVTNSAIILNDRKLIDKKNIDIIIIGGYLDKKMAAMISEIQKELLSKIRINKFFFSPYGISEEFGVMDAFAPQSCALKKYLFKNSKYPICIAGSYKFSITGAYNWLGIEELKTIITDESISTNIASTLRGKGIKVIIAH